MKTKDFGFEVKEVGEAGTFSGYGSTFGGTPDSYGEVIAAGAFLKSLREHAKAKTMPFMLWQHDPWQPIGVWEDMFENEKGLAVNGRLLIELNQGREAHILLREKAIRGLSIGYRERKVQEADPEKKLPRTLLELDLIEVSVVTRPANRKATVTSVKNEDAVAAWARLEEIGRKVRESEPPSPSELEKVLRDAGFPKTAAVGVVSRGWGTLLRDVGSDQAIIDAARKSVKEMDEALSTFKLPTLK